MSSYIIQIFDDEVEVSTQSLDANVDEMKTIFEEKAPYLLIQTITGTVYSWNDDFIEKIQRAMSTDDLSDMDYRELEIWNIFVQYQEYHATYPLGTEGSTDGYIGFIGCTVPSGEFAYDETGDSYVVLGDGTVTDILCQSATNPVLQLDLMISLDNVLMDIYRCQDYSATELYDGELTDVQPCSV